MNEAQHCADLINNVYGQSMTLTWHADDLDRVLPDSVTSDWKDGRQTLTFADGSRAMVTYGNGVTITPITGVPE